jgi:peptidoglycan/xylan/chitin deacetylase (PgdA/CDA1 family)
VAQKSPSLLVTPSLLALYGRDASPDVDSVDRVHGLGAWLPVDRPGQQPVRPTVVTTFQAGHGFAKGSAAGTQTDDTAVYALGSQSLRMDTDGAGTACFTQKLNISPAIDLSGRTLKLLVWLDDPTQWKELSVYLSSETPSVTWTNFVKCGVVPSTVPTTPWVTGGQWLEVTMSRGDFTTTGTGVSWNAITGIRLRFADQGAGSPRTGRINLIESVPEPARGIVSFTFDDGWLSQYTEARKKLDQYRFPATAYVIGDYVDVKPGYVTSAQLTELQDLHDWEVASHAGTGTVHDARFPSVAETDLEADLLRLRRQLTFGGHRGQDHLAYPGGQYDATTLKLMRRYFASGRTIFKSNASGVATSETYPPADWLRLRAWSLNGTTAAVSTDGPTVVNAAIDHAAANKEWLILVFHKLVAARSNPETSTEYLIADFASIVDKAAATAGIAVKTIGDVMRSGAA